MLTRHGHILVALLTCAATLLAGAADAPAAVPAGSGHAAATHRHHRRCVTRRSRHRSHARRSRCRRRRSHRPATAGGGAAPGAPAVAPAAGTGGGGSAAGPQTSGTPVGTPPLGDAQAAAMITPAPETRPGNAAANGYVPSAAELAAFRAARTQYGQTIVQWNPLYRYVDGLDGLVAPSTDELIQWAAHKWGIPEDWLRADIAQESWWRQDTLGDRSSVPSSWYALYPPQARIAGGREVYESMGVAQVKWLPDGSIGAGTEPLRWRSTAFDLDYYAATVRYFYDGYCHWCGGGYGAGQQWNSIAAWFSPYPWGNAEGQAYARTVQALLAQRVWAQPGF